MVAPSNKPSQRSRFLPVLVTAGVPHVATEFAAVLAHAVEGHAEAVPLDGIESALRVPGGTGALVYVPGEVSGVEAALGAVLQRVSISDRGLPVLVVADALDAVSVAAVLRRGAADALFLSRGDEGSLARLRALIARRAERASGTLFADQPGAPRMIGSAPSMREMARLVERVAAADATVLILGESGTGKELVAAAVHALSPRRKGPFVAINCAAIPETLLENELFGHEKGAYTGASSTAIGKVEAAEKGTLFLDEIGEMPLQLQSKILRLLQERTYDRIGGTKTRKADVRIVAATNKDLKEEAARKRFREDLYYRLSVVPIPLPALRDRREDIPLIANYILERLAVELARPGLTLSQGARDRLFKHPWPGNVRELENELERAVVLAGRDEIQPEDLELKLRVEDPETAALSRLAPLNGPLAETCEVLLRKAARIRIVQAMSAFQDDRDLAAASLGITREELDAHLG